MQLKQGKVEVGEGGGKKREVKRREVREEAGEEGSREGGVSPFAYCLGGIEK